MGVTKTCNILTARRLWFCWVSKHSSSETAVYSDLMINHSVNPTT